MEDWEKTNDYPDDEFPYDVEDELGEIISSELECPGVYYIATRQEENQLVAQEAYIVEADTPIIPIEAKSYGTPLSGNPNLLRFSMEDDCSGHRIISYEIYKYRVKHGLPLEENETLRDAAVYATEFHPEYFGTYPAPALTPWGYTLRHKDIENGIYWIETDQCKWVLAVCYPFWTIELSELAQKLAVQTEFDSEQGIDNTYGYLFFSKEDACIPVFEMLPSHPGLLQSGRVNMAALMNAIWKYHPEYAALYNTREQAGLNDVLGLLMKALGNDCELQSSVGNMISLSPDVGSYFWRFPLPNHRKQNK